MLKSENILVIDDEQVILDAVSRIASAEGLNVDADNSAKSALKKLSHKEYSLILCDILMPEMDGFMDLEKLQDQKITNPVIMITGFSTVENAVKSLFKGAIDFIPKPFTFEELKSHIHRGLQFYRLQKRIEEVKTKNTSSESMPYVPCPPKYHRLGHLSWMNVEAEGIVKLGATNLFLETIINLNKIELMNLDDLLIQGDTCADFITDDDLVHHFLSPAGGRIIERNEKLLTDIKLLQKDPYFNGWIYKIIPENIEYDMQHLIPCASDRM